MITTTRIGGLWTSVRDALRSGRPAFEYELQFSGDTGEPPRETGVYVYGPGRRLLLILDQSALDEHGLGTVDDVAAFALRQLAHD